MSIIQRTFSMCPDRETNMVDVCGFDVVIKSSAFLGKERCNLLVKNEKDTNILLFLLSEFIK